MERTKERVVADLRRHSVQTSKFEKELNNLNNALKREEKSETNLKDIFDTMQAEHDEYRKAKEKQLTEVECSLDTIEKRLSVTLEYRVEMEKRLENLNVFCEAVYSTLKSKESSHVSLVKEAQLDHPGGQNGQKTRKKDEVRRSLDRNLCQTIEIAINGILN
ncbi:uncharacterized protein LOC112198699 [Rosa chinensis]|uniref:uncharacterized protein LOC112198699 n=1 Tax=Rosa chinensis TaxID=74649 RepID=UPI001AD90BDE|nr:uncharacterized protein LOC112198699 [Rosa chinensis]